MECRLVDSMIENGIYYIKANKPQSTDFFDWFYFGSWNLGDKYLKLFKDKNAKNPLNSEKSTSYAIHGGKSYGDNKGIDLAMQDLAFFEALQNLTNKYKVELENTNNEIRVEVKYESQMVLEVVRKWEYSPNNQNFAYWATISEFTLKKDGDIMKDSQGKDIKGYIIEPAGINPHRMGKLSQNQQQTTSGSDTRIPAGEYRVFWRYVSKSSISADENYIKQIGISKFNKRILLELYADNQSNMGARSEILIHIGNTGKDTLGCLMPNRALTIDKKDIIMVANNHQK